MIRLAVVAGGLAGALGVAAMAAGAHGSGENLRIAGQFLLFHGPAFLAIAAILRLNLCHILLGHLALGLLLGGLALFAGDLAMRALAGRALFTAAAPLGGSGLILGWLMLAAAALVTGTSQGRK
ncbi:COG2363 Uncharacterized small membrane protein [Rhabdaerophilaceae bacterium]